MTYAQMVVHLEKFKGLSLGFGHRLVGDWHWPAMHGQCGCGAAGSCYCEDGHREHELAHEDAVRCEVATAGGRKDFIKVWGAFVRSSTPEQLGELLAVQTFGE